MLSTEAIEPVDNEFSVSVIFNEAVTGLEESDFLITHGTLTVIDESHYTIIITPDATGDMLIDLPIGVVEDTDLNENLAAETLIVHADFDSPRTELYTDASEPVTGTFTVFIEFTEAVNGLSEHEIDITNGFVSAGSLATEDNITFSLEIIPQSTGDVIVQVPAGVAEDVDHYANLASEPLIVVAELPSHSGEYMINDFVCYPNPGHGLLNLEITEDNIGAGLEIYDATGTLVSQSILTKQQHTIDLTGATHGIYLIKIVKDNLKLTKRLIVE